MDAVKEFCLYWKECWSWSMYFLWDILWDQKSFLLLIVGWAGLVLKNWNQLGWKSAGWKLMKRATLAMQALRWPAIVVLGVFALLLLFVAPAQKYRELQARQMANVAALEKNTVDLAEKDAEIIRLTQRERTLEAETHAAGKGISQLQKLAKERDERLGELKARLDKRAAIESIVKTVIAFKVRGDQLQERAWHCVTKEKPQIEKDYIQWLNEVRSYLSTLEDTSYLSDFNDESQHPAPMVPPKCIGPDKAGGWQLWDAIKWNVSKVHGIITTLRSFIGKA